jgi:hypothetical protein
MPDAPLIESLRRLRPRREPGAAALYGLIAAVALFLACLPFLHAAQDAQVRKFHLASESFPEWAALQIVPAMYNFQNGLDQSFDAMCLNPWLHPGASAFHTSTNHYPLHIMTYALNRKRLIVPAPFYAYLRSKYGGREWCTFTKVTSRDQTIRVQIGRTCEFDVR